MQLTAVIVATLVSIAAAANCKTGLFYCHNSLLARGNYSAQIKKAIEKFAEINPYHPHTAVIQANPTLALFMCDDSNGEGPIHVIMKCCNYCIDGGSDHSDYCNDGQTSTWTHYNMAGPVRKMKRGERITA